MEKNFKYLLMLLLFIFLFSNVRAQPLLKFFPDTLHQAKVGEYYEARIYLLNNDTPIDYFIATAKNDSFPREMVWEFNDSTNYGIIKGIPQKPGEYEFTVKVSCFGTQVSGQTGSKKYKLKIKENKIPQGKKVPSRGVKE
ncbi:MAG: hypothetical protein KGY74_08800 [Candidatus Cloacimonetes bacterium]|nr:hypothetical protein [Candidatus Cloacimonadota bacterium]